MNKRTRMPAPAELSVVVDEQGKPLFVALSPDRCAEYILNAYAEEGIGEAARWHIEPYTKAERKVTQPQEAGAQA